MPTTVRPLCADATKEVGRPIRKTALLLGALAPMFLALLVTLLLGMAMPVAPGPGGGEDAARGPSHLDRIESASDALLKRAQFRIDWVELPAAFSPGQISKVRVRVSNGQSGQELPIGLPEGRFAWIDLTLVDAMGRKIHRRAPIEEGKADAAFGFVLPADAAGPIEVRADLNDRPSPRTLIDSLLSPNGPPIEVNHLASVAAQVPLPQVQPTAADEMQRLLLLLALGRSR
jgi:hypothetical protein